MQGLVAIARSVWLFVLAGACEIGGGWLVWKWLRNQRPGWWGGLGGLVLVLYGIIPIVGALRGCRADRYRGMARSSLLEFRR